ncbi:Hypothetical predicted protein [Cloeon dipterum]|uniref:SCP domain-containing protein n=1 Tax=Cloeon dipterum TaxID=197152 RepID=A0A8S1DCP3_9INSE|nr:Hypothetical predicted protein [Cloeon dipterum]
MRVLTNLLLLTCLVVAEEKDGVETCHDEKYAKYPNHVMCLKPRKCSGKEIWTVETGEEDKLAMLHTLNTFRSLIASGRTAVYRPATNMRQLTWDEELATLAQRFAEHCDRYAKFNFTVDRFPVGEVIMTYEEKKITLSNGQPPHVLKVTKTLFVRAFDFSYLLKDIPRWRPTPYGNYFTQLIWAKSHLVGCGYTLFVEGKTGVRMLVCLFGPKGNVANASVYEEGEPKCDIPSKYYEGLCTEPAVNRAFKPIPCHKEIFSIKYRALCAPDNYFRWIHSSLPYQRTFCDESFWRQLFYGTVTAALITFLALILGTLFYFYQRKLFIV